MGKVLLYTAVMLGLVGIGAAYWALRRFMFLRRLHSERSANPTGDLVAVAGEIGCDPEVARAVAGEIAKYFPRRFEDLEVRMGDRLFDDLRIEHCEGAEIATLAAGRCGRSHKSWTDTPLTTVGDIVRSVSALPRARDNG